MSSAVQGKALLEIENKRAWQLSRERTWELLGITAIIIFAAWLRFSNLDSLGYVNHYYTAGVKSMLQSWHNFFYVAAEPGGSVSIDKPPVGLWLQAISAYFLGVNGFSVLLPQLLAGILSVIVLYYLVRRSFGVIPGLIAALVLAISPIVVATDRNNTMDSSLILMLLLAAWAFIKATETSKLRYLLVGVALVGIGFNIKMLQAYLSLPAFYAMYFLGSQEKMWAKVGKLVMATVLLLTVSLSWAVTVDLTPADRRPYVGSSSDNSELNLILGYNGVNRLLGMFGRRGNNPPSGFVRPPDQGQLPQGNGSFPPDDGNGNRPPLNDGQANNGNRGPGGFNIGTPGALRLFIPPLSKETSWLLPFGIISLVLLTVGPRWQWPITSKHQALVLWGGWLITCAVFFSIAGFFHEYYLSMMAPPLAALVGIGIYQLWQSGTVRPWLAAGVLSTAAIITLVFQMYTAANFVENIWWLSGTIAFLVIGLGTLIVAASKRKQSFGAALGFALVTASMLVTPGIWSVLTNLSASQNQSLPSAYSGGSIGPVTQADIRINEKLLEYLQANTEDNTYLMAVPSSMQGADYVLATGRPVLYLGGFNGQDDVASVEDLTQMIIDGELRYIYWSENDRGPQMKSDLSSWVTSACTAVGGFETATQNFGAPDGTMPGANHPAPQNTNRFGPGNMQMTLFDCVNLRE